jgi:hypothetical protein
VIEDSRDRRFVVDAVQSVPWLVKAPVLLGAVPAGSW